MTQYDKFISHNLETTPLEIKTDSAAGSSQRVYIQFFDGSLPAGGLDILFSSSVKYRIPYCYNSGSYKTDFSNSLPSTMDKVWRVTLDRSSGIRYKLDCNDVEVLNVVVDGSECAAVNNWNTNWSKTIVGFQMISGKDTASDSYRASGTIVVLIS